MEATKKLISLFSAIIVLIFACLLLLSSSTLADSQTTITHLPGFNGPLPFHLETGYVLVDEKEDANMFYYFIQSENNPSDDPLMLWLTGGPGCSALSGLMWEIGPLTIDVENFDGGFPTLIQRENSWTKIANIIFLDSPIGTGFSYSKNFNPYRAGDFDAVSKMQIFLEKWFATHQNFRRNSFYVGGDSYSGIPLPVLVKKISQSNDAEEGTPINLKGYLLGNPVTDDGFNGAAKIPFAHGMGLISDELYELAKESCDGKYSTPKDEGCAKYVKVVNKLTERISINHILEPACDYFAPVVQVTDRRINEYARDLPIFPTNSSYCRAVALAKFVFIHHPEYGYYLGTIWANDDLVREALGITKRTVDTWERCNFDRIEYTRNVASSIPYHHYLTTRGYRSLIYSGDHDIRVPFLGTQAWIRSLNYSIVKEWRPWWVDRQVGGYTRTYSNNLTFATVKGGGHTAPETRPKECQELIRQWLYDDSF